MATANLENPSVCKLCGHLTLFSKHIEADYHNINSRHLGLSRFFGSSSPCVAAVGRLVLRLILLLATTLVVPLMARLKTSLVAQGFGK